ncbi:MAG TPA: helix-turn-helix transcriptional regulator, partial [Atopobiaceae bacterium]|nr:helix-turn-helix transcriptional regulator [Atopobiaceae bacterium]
LRERREECGMTQAIVAQSLGVSRQAVSKWENGSSDPSTTNLIALAELYAVDPIELIKGIAKSKDA